MPTIFIEGRYRVFFFSADRLEAPHVHVEAGGDAAKYWLDPLALAWSRGFNTRELNSLQRLIEAKREVCLEAWNEYFG